MRREARPAARRFLPPAPGGAGGRSGMTLVEVLLAATILGLGVATLAGGLANCLAIMRAAREYQEAQWVLGLGELAHIMTTVEKIEELEVPPDTSLADGFTFERTVDEKDVFDEALDDGLYVVRTRVVWGAGGPAQSEELVRYVWKKGVGAR